MEKDSSKKIQWLEDNLHEDNFFQTSSHPEKYKKNTSKTGLPNGWKRATFILKEDHVNKLKAYAYWERITIKDLIEEIIESYLNNKKIIDIPPKKIPSKKHE